MSSAPPAGHAQLGAGRPAQPLAGALAVQLPEVVLHVLDRVEAEAVQAHALAAVREDFAHHVALLVDLDGIDRRVRAPV